MPRPNSLAASGPGVDGQPGRLRMGLVLLLAGLAASAGCSTPPLDAPVLEAITPAEVPAGEVTAVTIRGRGFTGRVRVSVVSDSLSVDQSYDVWLTNGGRLYPLEAVVWRSVEEIGGEVPAHIPAGAYGLLLRDPSAREAELPEALVVVLTACGGASGCGDTDPCTVNERCEHSRCVHDLRDADGDGHIDLACGGDDCDDTPGPGGDVYPGAREVVADGVDQSCDDVDLCYQDLDGDGFGASVVIAGDGLDCDGGAAPTAGRTGDCDDAGPCGSACFTDNPALDHCDGFDDDCDGAVDEDAPRWGWYPDCDGDGVAGPAVLVACDTSTPPPCSGGAPAAGSWRESAPAELDCDDGKATWFPHQQWYADCDGDGAFASEALISCSPPEAPCTGGAAPAGGWIHAAPASPDCDDDPAGCGAACAPSLVEEPAAGNCLETFDNDCDLALDLDDPPCAVLDTPPIPVVRVVPPAGTTSTLFTADGTGSVDIEDGTELAYEWDWTGDGVIDATTASASFTLGEVGEHAVVLRASDSRGRWAYASFVVVVAAESDFALTTTGTDESDAGDTPGIHAGRFSLREAIAWANAAPGAQTVLIPAGTVVAPTDQLTTPSDPDGVVIVADGAVLDGSTIAGAGSSCLDIDSSNNRIYGLEIRNCSGWPIYIYGAATGNRIARCFIHDCAFNVQLEGVDNVFGPDNEVSGIAGTVAIVVDGRARIEHNRIHDNVGVGLRLANTADGSAVVGNVVFANAAGVDVRANSNAHVVWHNTVADNGAAGFAIAASVIGLDLRNNLVTGNGGYGLSARTTNFAQLDSNGLFANALGACDGCAGLGSASVLLDPLYVSGAARDYRLGGVSPAIDAGTDLGADVNGPAPGPFNGAGPDLGASEAP